MELITTYFGAGLLLALVHLLFRPGKYWAPEDALYIFLAWPLMVPLILVACFFDEI